MICDSKSNSSETSIFKRYDIFSLNKSIEINGISCFYKLTIIHSNSSKFLFVKVKMHFIVDIAIGYFSIVFYLLLAIRIKKKLINYFILHWCETELRISRWFGFVSISKIYFWGNEAKLMLAMERTADSLEIHIQYVSIIFNLSLQSSSKDP